MNHDKFPYTGVSEGISDFGDSLCVKSLYPDTRISDILRRFRVTGVLPSVGRMALPADVVFGDADFASLRARLDEARAAGVTEAQIEELINGKVNGVVDTSDGQSSVEGGMEFDSRSKAGGVADQGDSPANI